MITPEEESFFNAIKEFRTKHANTISLSGPQRRAAFQQTKLRDIFEMTRLPDFACTPYLKLSHPVVVHSLAIALAVLMNATSIKPWMFKPDYIGHFVLQIEDPRAHLVIYRLIEKHYGSDQGNTNEIIDNLEFHASTPIFYDLALELKTLPKELVYAFKVLSRPASLPLFERLGLNKPPAHLMNEIDPDYELDDAPWIIVDLEKDHQEEVEDQEDGVQEDGVQDQDQEDEDSRFVSTPWWKEEDEKKRPREVIDLTDEDHKHNNLEERKKPRNIEVIDLTGDDDQ